MKFLRPFSLFEALDLKTAKKMTDIFIKSGGKQRYESIFKGEDRIYYDFLPGEDQNEISPIGEKVKKELEDKGFSLLSYREGTATKIGDDKNVFKIQRLLVRWGLETLKNEMDKDPSRSLAKHQDKKIVISRHGIDIAGASTDRSWSSCLTLKGGSNARYIPTMIEAGALIAYLIDSNDLNINNPLARIKINPFINVSDPTKFLMYPDPTPYGNYKNDDFMDWIENWALELNKTLNPQENSKYVLDNRCYADGRSTVITQKDYNMGKNMKVMNPENLVHHMMGRSSTSMVILKNSDTWTFEQFYDNAIEEKLNEEDILEHITKIKEEGYLNLVIDYINNEDNQKTAEFTDNHLKLMNALLKSLGKDIFKIKDEKSKIIVTGLFSILPPDVQELLISNDERLKILKSKNPYFIDWIVKSLFKFNLIDPKFITSND